MSGQMGKGVGAMFDGDLLPLQRIPPQYPRDAARAGITGWVQLEVLVNADGTVRSAKVVDSKPRGIFEAAAVQAHFEQQMPESLFAAADAAPLRDGLMQIARAFFALIMDPDALAGHRIMCTPQVVETGMPQQAWAVGPQRAIDMVADVLRHHVESGGRPPRPAAASRSPPPAAWT